MKDTPAPLPTLQTEFATRAASFQQRAQRPATGPEQPALKEQLNEFSSLLFMHMLQVMRQTIPRSGLLNTGFAYDLYTSLFDQEIARLLAQRQDLGLSALLERHVPSTAAFATPDVAQTKPALASPGAGETGSSQPGRWPRAQQALSAYRRQGEALPGEFIVPVDGQLTSSYGMRHHPIDGGEKRHNGVDLAASEGTVIRAAAAGQVVFSGTRSGFGRLVIVEHQNGYATYYGHNATNLVAVGTYVERGQPVATVGQSGRATGPHVHFEVHRDGEPLDPLPFLSATASAATALKFLSHSADKQDQDT
jgi:murein DD-endopeptidase MepM/ murein hydrolase activator NlpD